MRECWNRQTGTFEVRVSLTCGFKSHLAHFQKTAEFRQFLVIVVHSISLFENMLRTFCPFASQFFH